ncbi:MAG: hypothetical protein JO024_09540 [Candidatus Eremiobacteraeota bacterium]|nr:hypothetical protein [Candidatus Eremiobacteraeota bacterium]MBV9736633.1 hypothetical protein [Candidatus Eremiobacteraeota bacterium]
MKARFFAAATAVLFLLAGALVSAQTTPAPTPVALPTVPPTVNPIVQSVINALAGRVKADFGWEPNRARGVVTYFRHYDMQIRFANGTYRDVHLHQGTVINPRGASIEVGNRVDIQGQMNGDGSLNANVINLY